MLLNDFVEFGADQSQLMELCLLSYSIVHPTVRVLKTHTVGLQTSKDLVPHLNGQL